MDRQRGENSAIFLEKRLKNVEIVAYVRFFYYFCAIIFVTSADSALFDMYWTLELASKIEDAPWPATKEELLDYANRIGAPMEVIENLQEIEEDEEIFESIEDIWPDYPTKDDFFFDEEEY